MSLITSHRGWQASHFRCRSQARINSEGHPTAARLCRGWTPDYRAKCSNLRPRPARAPPPSPLSSLCPTFFLSSPSYLFSILSYPTVASFLFPGVSARRPEIQNFFCNKSSPSLPPLLPPCPSCWSRSRVTAGGVATILSSFTHFLTLPPPPVPWQGPLA